jgi:23S rRNA pseudouridine2605 synthase
MSRADAGGRAPKPTGLRADGTPRRPAHSDAARRAARADPPRTPRGEPGRAEPASRARGVPPRVVPGAPARAAKKGGGTAGPPQAAGRTAGASRTPAAAPGEPAGGPERLQKLLSAAGVGSRRACEELIAAGRVTVDGRVATLGDRADPTTAVIHVDGERVVTDARRVYLAINKPAGVVSTMSDEKGRAALADYLGNVAQRVYHVGRLDKDSEGLLLLTNDGDLAHRLMHPSYGVLKTYLAEVPGPVRSGLRRRLLDGVDLEDGTVAVDAFRVVDTSGGRALVEVVLHEGRKHLVRRLLAEVGHPVLRLVRTSIGPVKLGDLRSGRNRRLTPAEIAALFQAVGG